MGWMWLPVGLVFGWLVTYALIWHQRRTSPDLPRQGYPSRVALSVVVTALIAGLARLALEYMAGGALSGAGIALGGGWLLGGLLAGWLLTHARQQP